MEGDANECGGAKGRDVGVELGSGSDFGDFGHGDNGETDSRGRREICKGSCEQCTNDDWRSDCNFRGRLCWISSGVAVVKVWR